MPSSNGSVPSTHNQLSDDQKALLLIKGVKEIEEYVEQQREITAMIRSVRKRLKSDGFETAVVNYTLYLRKTDPEKAVEEHRQQLRIARWLAHPIGSQAEFDLDQPVDRAFDEGKAAGLQGLSCEPDTVGYASSSPEGQRWIEGWNAGQSVLLGQIHQAQDAEQEDLEGIPDFLRVPDPLADVPL